MNVSERTKILASLKGKPKFRMVNDRAIVTADNKLHIWAEPEGFTYDNYNRAPSVHGRNLNMRELLKVIEQFA